MVTWSGDKNQVTKWSIVPQISIVGPLITIQLPDFLSAIQVTIQLTDHLDIKHIFTIWIPDVFGNQMSNVFKKLIWTVLPSQIWFNFYSALLKPRVREERDL